MEQPRYHMAGLADGGAPGKPDGHAADFEPSRAVGHIRLYARLLVDKVLAYFLPGLSRRDCDLLGESKVARVGADVGLRAGVQH